MKSITLLLTALLCAMAPALQAAEDFDIRGRGTIIHVTDGDTFIVRAQSTRTIQRFIDVDFHVEQHEDGVVVSVQV